ncbi:MAG TPA: hypothetical protein VEY50_09180 [Lysobacter sp.]|nr:hypothetical protein [Lysobacter sp.]
MTTADPITPLACSLDGHAFQVRLQEIAALNARHLRSERRLGTTLELEYAVEACAQVEAMIERERECCAFLDFRLAQMGDRIALTITVPEQARDQADVLLQPFTRDNATTAASCCGGSCG